jgi:hypothetical protein
LYWEPELETGNQPQKAAPGSREAAGRGVKQQHAVRGTRHCQQLQTLAERVTRSSSPSVGGVAIKKPSDGSFAFDVLDSTARVPVVTQM